MPHHMAIRPTDVPNDWTVEPRTKPSGRGGLGPNRGTRAMAASLAHWCPYLFYQLYCNHSSACAQVFVMRKT